MVSLGASLSLILFRFHTRMITRSRFSSINGWTRRDAIYTRGICLMRGSSLVVKNDNSDRGDCPPPPPWKNNQFSFKPRYVFGIAGLVVTSHSLLSFFVICFVQKDLFVLKHGGPDPGKYPLCVLSKTDPFSLK